MNPPVADALVELVVQSQQIGISVLTLGGGRFDGMLGAGVQHGRLGIFADTHLDFSGQVVGVECEPSGVHLSEIEHQGARARSIRIGPAGRMLRVLPDAVRISIDRGCSS